MTISINQIKSGLTIYVDGEVYAVSEFQHVKPGKGAAFVRVKLRNLKTGAILDRTFRGDDKIVEAFIEERKLQYQYGSADILHFMDQQNFEEVLVSKDILQDKIKFLKDNLEVIAYAYRGEILNVSLPNFIEFSIIHTEPGIRGDTAKGSSKPATIETGATVQVPLFVDIGDKIKIDTRSGEYIGRV